MTHSCACHTVQPTGLPSFLSLVIHPSSQLHRRFELMLHAHGIPAQTDEQTLTVDAGDVPQLRAVLAGLPEGDRASIRAVPFTSQGPQMWELRPLHTWVERLSSDWFEQATRNLVFHGQPIVRMDNGQVLGYEALVRARVEGQLIGAGALLEAAAAHEQLRAFDALARITAITQLYGRLAPAQLLFINFAPGVIYNPDICLRTTFQACREVKADFSRLVFEITEGEAFPDLRLLRSIMERYRSEGARIALDDLGAGHTSLSYLAELRPDIVKLDRALIQGLHASAPAARLVRSLTDYAHDLGIQVVAEGIEQPEDLEAVRAAGVDFAQGYYLGRPAEVLAPVSAGAREHWKAIPA